MSVTKEEFQIFYEKNYWKVYKYVFSKLNQREAAEDLLQEAFLACYEALERYDSSKCALSTWFYVILNNRMKNYYRDQKISSDIDDYAESLSMSEMDMPFQAVHVQECRDMVHELLKELPELNRKIVVYRYFMDMSHKEIAEQIGISEGNVRVILSRTIKKMCKSYDKRKDFLI